MMLILHIVTALSSLVFATFALIMPSQAKLTATYSLGIATLASGVFLVWQLHAPIASSCMTGVVYLALLLPMLVVSRARLKKAAL